jgi:acetoin utilization deacetylase AcuC-like enzyme
MDDLVYFYPEGHAAHYEVGHPERPERVEVIRIALQKLGWWDSNLKLAPLSLSENVLHNVHSPEYLNLLEMSCRRGGHLDADTYLTPASWRLALASAGGAAAVAQAVWQRQAKYGFALTRPPGHHAMRGQGMGFCLLNNAALAAEFLIQSENAERLAVIDLDLHHGNGTQDIFWGRGDVFYISTHQSPLYPGSGALEDTGAGAGSGWTANFPLPPGAGDTAFLAVMDELILPLLVRYRPEMILVSYGFDTHWSDPLGHLLLTADGYHKLISSLVSFAQRHCAGKLALFLEGGYNLDAGAACSRSVVAALLGQNEVDSLGPSPYPEGTLWRGMLERAHKLWGI